MMGGLFLLGFHRAVGGHPAQGGLVHVLWVEEVGESYLAFCALIVLPVPLAYVSN